jgi:hypothetical protein
LLFYIIFCISASALQFFKKEKDMTDARKNWQEKVKKEEELLQKFLIQKMQHLYHHKHFRFSERKTGKPHFHVTATRRLMGEEISHYAKFVYWSLLLFYVNKNHTLQSAHNFTMRDMRERLKRVMVASVTSGIRRHRTFTAMQTLGLEDPKLHLKPKKPNALLQLPYYRSDFKKGKAWLDVNQEQFDEKKGHLDAIQKIANQYKTEVAYLIPASLKKIDLKILFQYDKTIQRLLYPYDPQKIPKWIYWSMMENVYQESFSVERNGAHYPGFEFAHLCHVRVMNIMEKIFDESFVSKVFSGGSWLGKNDTVMTMKNIGIMDSRKYPGIFGYRLCLLAKPFHVSPVIAPSMKELAGMRGGAEPKEYGSRRYWRP